MDNGYHGTYGPRNSYSSCTRWAKYSEYEYIKYGVVLLLLHFQVPNTGVETRSAVCTLTVSPTGVSQRRTKRKAGHSTVSVQIVPLISDL